MLLECHSKKIRVSKKRDMLRLDWGWGGGVYDSLDYQRN